MHLQNVMGQVNQLPLHADLVELTEQKLAKTPHVYDLSKDRLRKGFADGIDLRLRSPTIVKWSTAWLIGALMAAVLGSRLDGALDLRIADWPSSTSLKRQLS